jgi:hypothetical protein
MSRFYDILNSINDIIIARQGCGSDCGEYNDTPEEKRKELLEEELELAIMKQKLKDLRKSKAEDGDFMNIEDMELETIEEEMMEYKKDFYHMSVGSLRAIATHAQKILDSLDNPQVNENLTESWLQGKIAITEDYMRTIHDFVMFVADADDNNQGVGQAKKPGLWENIRKKKEREGKNYRPAKPGDKDRPDSDQWKKLTKDNKDKKDK